MKNNKTFYESQVANCVKEIVQIPPLSPTPPDRSLLRLWKKNFLTDIYRNIQIFPFKVLLECSSWASRNGAVQMFFLTPSDICWKICKVKKVSSWVAEHIFSMLR